MQTHEPREEFVERLESVIARELAEARQRSTRDMASRRRSTSAGWHVGLAAAAAVIVAVVIWQAPAIHDAMTHGAGLAVVETADATLSRASGQVVHARERIAAGEMVRTNGDAGAMLALADGSRVEMRAQSELLLEKADDGLSIRLSAGSIIVNAAKQPGGHLYVQTKDMTVSVVGTVFLVNAEADGSRVAVIEGEVRVHERSTDTRLHPGEQLSTSPKLEGSPVKDAIAWSRHSDVYGAYLESFARGMADTAGQLMPLARASNAVQSAPGPVQGEREFEEASVRLCDPAKLPPAPAGGRGGIAGSLQMTPGRLHILCMTVATMVRTAYGFASSISFEDRDRGRLTLDNISRPGVEDGIRVRGGSDWVRTEPYTIEATADDTADAQMMSRTMLQALLERRFQLKAHVESEQIPAFELTVTKTGLKMKEGTCRVRSLAEMTAPSTARSRSEMVQPIVDAVRRGETPICVSESMSHGPNMIFVGAGDDVPSSALRGILGMPVIDRTGIPASKRFNWILEFAPDENTKGAFTRGLTPTNDPSIPRAANIFTAVEEQLGLNLEPSREGFPREFLIIDSVARPTPN